MTESDSLTKNRAILLSIAGIPVIVILAATWLWYFVVYGDLDLVNMLGTANRGALVQPPRQLGDQPLRDDKGQLVELSDMEPRWTMLVPGAGDRCDGTCEKSLYLTRQIRLAMGKEFNRLRRVYVSEVPAQQTFLAVPELSDQRPVPVDFMTYLAVEHPGLDVLTLDTGGYDSLFAEHREDPRTWYLVDPAGWIMMSYNSNTPYKDVISDLKFLLKNSGG